MSSLETYIRNHRDLFDEEPAAGHFERLQQKINRSRQRIVTLRWGISIAASVAVLFAAGMTGWYAGKPNDAMLVCENASDMKLCYLNRMNAVASQIEELTKDFDQWDQQQVMTDVQNIIDAAASGGLENELPEELPNHQTQAILSDYYRQNLESLETIVKSINN